jgi:hypothetical protein
MLPVYGGMVKVAGERVGLRVPGDFAVRLRPRGFRGISGGKCWVVDDCETGAAISVGSTRKQALINARKLAEKHGEAGFTKARKAFLKRRKAQALYDAAMGSDDGL